MNISLSPLAISLYVLAALLLGWAALAVVSRALYRRSLGLPFFPVKVIHAVPDASVEDSKRAAAERRRRLEEFLREFAAQGVASREFIELPPGLKLFGAQERREFTQGDAAYWHTSRLNLQLENDHHLLIERLTDTLVCLYRSRQIERGEFPVCVRLERVARRAAPDTFPWRVVISSDHPKPLTEWLSRPEISSWLGIGVDIVPASPPVRKGTTRRTTPPDPSADTERGAVETGKCSVGGDGLEGVMAGLVRDGLGEYGLTCRHVLSSNCGSAYWPPQTLIRPPNREFTDDSPDAAFVTLTTDCFIPAGQPSTPVSALDLAGIQLEVQHEAKLKKSTDPDGSPGLVKAAQVSGFMLKDYFYRGVHVMLAPHFTKRFYITWPLKRRFTKPGDSGAWVFDAETESWVGMVVGANRWPNTQSYALAGYYLLDAFHLYQKSKGLPVKAPPVAEIFRER